MFVYGLTDVGWRMWGVICGTALVGSCSQFSMTVGMQHEKSARASLMRMSDILCGFLWQVLFTHDALSVYTSAGRCVCV
jgi:drug/metabolite transporter (DMT)-like permease